MSDAVLLATTADVAKHAHITPRHVARLVQEGAVPRLGRNSFDLVAFLSAYVALLQKAMSSKSAMGPDGKITNTAGQRSALLGVAVERQQILLAKEAEEAMAVADHVAVVEDVILSARSAFLALGDRVSARVVAMTSQEAVRGAINAESREVLKQLAAGAHLPAGALFGRLGRAKSRRSKRRRPVAKAPRKAKGRALVIESRPLEQPPTDPNDTHNNGESTP